MKLPPVLRLLLWPLSVVYGEVVRIRVWLYAKGFLRQKHLSVPVISIGNLTVGGTGKTPMVVWLAERFLREGKRVGILSRGYKGTRGTSDEIELMKVRLKDRALFGLGPDRYEQGRRLEQIGIDVLLLDDGYQHLRLARDINILLIDGSKTLKHQRLLPAGELREPIREIGRADMIVITRKAEHRNAEAQDSHTYNLFYSQTQLLGFRVLDRPNQPQYLTEIGPGPFFAFCGIGNPGAFLNDLDRWHVPVCGHLFYPDHHRYTEVDARGLGEHAKAAGAVGFVTTEKDWMNLGAAGKLALPTYITVISLLISSEGEFDACLRRKLQQAGRVP